MKSLLTIVLSLFLMSACGTDLSCGAGTVDKDGECVPKSGGTDPTLATVSAVELTSLFVSEEGVRKVYVNYPLHVSGEIKVTGEAFETDLVVGLSSADGSKNCVAGSVSVSHEGGEESATVVFADSFFVQAGCDNLAGESDVRTWVAFDPFYRVNVSGREVPAVPSDSTQADMVGFVQKATLASTSCTSPASSHPETCDTKLEVVKSPGLDLDLADMTLGSSVALVSDKQTSAPDITASSEFRVYGAAFDEDTDLLEDKPVSSKFYLAPKIDFAAMPDAATMAIYAPRELKVLDYSVSKAGETSLKELRQKFLNSLQAETVKLQGFALRLDKETRTLLHSGKWSPFVKFEVTACVTAPFEEVEAEGVNDDNNCRSSDLIIARDVEPTAGTLGGHGPEKFVLQSDSKVGVTGSIGGWQTHKANQYGSTSTIGASLHPHARAVYVAWGGIGTAKYAELGMGLQANITGWFARELLDADFALRLPPSGSTKVKTSIRAMGYLMYSSVSVVNAEVAFSLSVPIASKSLGVKRSFKFLGVKVSTSLSLKNGCSGKLKGTLFLKDQKISASVGPSCGQSISGKSCISLLGKACAEGSITVNQVEVPLTATVALDVKETKPAKVALTATVKLSIEASLVKGKIKGCYGGCVTVYDFSWGNLSYVIWNIAKKSFGSLAAD